MREGMGATGSTNLYCHWNSMKSLIGTNNLIFCSGCNARWGGGAPPLKLEKIWFFGVKSWFFTRNTPNIFAPPSARRNFFICAPLTWNPGSAPECVYYFSKSTKRTLACGKRDTPNMLPTTVHSHAFHIIQPPIEKDYPISYMRTWWAALWLCVLGIFTSTKDKILTGM